MTLRDRIKTLANARGLSLPDLESELKFGNGTIVKWDKSIPNTGKLSAVADYFNVSVDYLLGREQPEELTNVYFSLAKEAEQNGIDPRDIKRAIEMIKSLRGEK